jgi:CelD/BcsL family acetyltransferase involved in cellulose biosynthesis
MLQVDILSPQDLSSRDRETWQAFRKATPAFQSPLLGPDFAETVAEVRSDTAVAVWRRGGQTIGFLAHHRRHAGLARPIGAPWSDYHALITAPGETLDAEAALRAAGISAFRFSGLLDPHGLFDGATAADVETYRIAFQDSGEAYWETLRALSPKRFKNLRRLEHKLERELGAPVLARDTNAPAFEQLLAWKRDQFRRTGLHDVLNPSWSHLLMQRLFRKRSGALQGLLLTLRVDGKPIAGHFGVREGEAFHPWIAAFDPALAAYSPGQTFISEAIRAMPRLGVSSYDLAAGSDHYKAPFASEVGTARVGMLRSRSAGPITFDRAADFAGAAFGPAGATAVRRLGRRVDHIAETELTLGGRMQGLAAAIAASSLRFSAEMH